jgi:hypothetical protein
VIGPAVIVAHGRKYHVDEACPRLVFAEYLWDFEGDPDTGRGGWTAGSYRRREASPERAAMCGKLPCLYCVPAELRVFPPLYGQTFGHEPVIVPNMFGVDETVCQRCTERGFWYSRGAEEPKPVRTLWPCTSALVLGLVERPAVLEPVR